MTWNGLPQRAKRTFAGVLLFSFLVLFSSCGGSTGQTGAGRDSFIDEPTNRFFTIGRHPWDAARIEVTGSYTISGVMVKLNQKNDTAGVPGQTINVRVFDHNPQLDQPGKAVGKASLPIHASTIPEVRTDITFTGLDTPVTPGTYWIVFHAEPTSIEHYIEMQGTNRTERGRALSYSADERTIDWTEFYYGQVNFVLYGS